MQDREFHVFLIDLNALLVATEQLEESLVELSKECLDIVISKDFGALKEERCLTIAKVHAIKMQKDLVDGVHVCLIVADLLGNTFHKLFSVGIDAASQLLH